MTAGSGESGFPAVSGDGRFVAFVGEATDLVASQVDPPLTRDVFLYDRVAGTTTLVSRTAASAVTTGSFASDSPVISADGRFVAFRSFATDLMAGQVDTPSTGDIFLYDRVAGTTTLVSRTVASGQTAGGNLLLSAFPAISADGRLVVLSSAAADLVADDHNGQPDVFAFTRCPVQAVRTLAVGCRSISGGPGRSAPARGAARSSSR